MKDIDKKELKRIEVEIREKYNPDDIFKNKKLEDNNKNLPIEIKRKNLLEKIIEFIKKIINKRVH